MGATHRDDFLQLATRGLCLTPYLQGLETWDVRACLCPWPQPGTSCPFIP